MILMLYRDWQSDMDDVILRYVESQEDYFDGWKIDHRGEKSWKCHSAGISAILYDKARVSAQG